MKYAHITRNFSSLQNSIGNENGIFVYLHMFTGIKFCTFFFKTMKLAEQIPCKHSYFYSITISTTGIVYS